MTLFAFAVFAALPWPGVGSPAQLARHPSLPYHLVLIDLGLLESTVVLDVKMSVGNGVSAKLKQSNILFAALSRPVKLDKRNFVSISFRIDVRSYCVWTTVLAKE